MSFDIANRFKYHPPASDERREAHDQIRSMCWSVADDFDVILPDSREKSLALTKLEEAMFWANASLARSPEEES